VPPEDDLEAVEREMALQRRIDDADLSPTEKVA